MSRQFFCGVCQLSWEGPEESWEQHEKGKTHRKRLQQALVLKESSGRDDVKDHGPAPAWAFLPRRSGTKAAEPLWPWPGTQSAFQKVIAGFMVRLFELGLPKKMHDTRLSGAAAVDENKDDLFASDTRVSQNCATKARAMQVKMRTCSQQPDDFSDIEALWGYAKAKFAQRASMAFNALTDQAPELHSLLGRSAVRIAAFGGGPAAELFAAAVARDLAGGRKEGKLVVYEWVDTWRPIVDAVAELLGEPIEYYHCDVTKPLSEEANKDLHASGIADFDLLIFSHVLLEASGGEDAASVASSSLALLRDLWTFHQNISYVLVLDAGQARGKDKRSRLLAGSLRAVEDMAIELASPIHRINGAARTDGVLMSRAPR